MRTTKTLLSLALTLAAGIASAQAMPVALRDANEIGRASCRERV